MSIHKYQVFVKVVELGSLTKAADLLGFTQSGVSHMINGLETEFGFPLLLRNRSGVRLTTNGEQVMRPIREMLNWHEQLNQTVASIHGLEVGVIRVGTITSVSVHWLPGMIKTFQEVHPAIEFKLLEGDYQDVENWLASGQVDCGFTILPARQGFETIPLKHDRMLAILPLDHPLAGAAVLSLQDIEPEPFIISSEGADDAVKPILEQAGVKPNIKFASGDDYAILAMVEHGLGISILPELVIQGRAQKVHVAELDGKPHRYLGITAPSLRDASPATKRFIHHVQGWIEEHEQGGPV